MSTDTGRRRTLQMLGAGAMALGTRRLHARADAPRGEARKDAPNIIFIMTDDHAQQALGIYGNTILRTPNLDRIGNEGLRFDQAFVTNSLCLPSRATFLTGQYSHTHGMRTNGEESGFTDEPALRNAATWPILLRAAGYHAGVVGKWHVNTPPQGYDYAAILPGHGQYFDSPMIINGERTTSSGHVDDVIGEHALKFLRQRPAGKPFCLLYQFKAPHRGWEPAPRFAHAFDDIEIPVPETFFESLEDRPEAVRKSQMRISRMHDFNQRGVPDTLPPREFALRNYQALVKNYYRVLLGVDENVGKLLAFLDDNGLAQDTIVVYTSDNGFFLGQHGLFDKRLMYEPSIRIPLLLRWPATIDAGRIDAGHFALNIDLAPTLLDLAGASVPSTMQGTSWRPLLDGGDPPWRKDFLYEYFEFPAAHCVRQHRGVRDQRWKYIHFYRDPEEEELYDLANDPREMRNLAADPAHAAELQRLRTRLAQLRRQYDDHDPPGFLPVPSRPASCPA